MSGLHAPPPATTSYLQVKKLSLLRHITFIKNNNFGFTALLHTDDIFSLFICTIEDCQAHVPVTSLVLKQLFVCVRVGGCVCRVSSAFTLALCTVAIYTRLFLCQGTFLKVIVT